MNILLCKVSTTCCLLLLITVGQVLGQEIPLDIITRINAVDYIFEGKVIKSTPYKTSNGKYIYTSNTIEISKILKGDLNCGTIELITDGGKVDGLWVDPSHTLDLHKGCQGIFLAKETGKELSAIDYYSETNYEKIEATFQDQSFIKYWHDGIEWRISDVWANFDSLAQVYNLAELITGLNFVDCGVPTIVEGGGASEAPVREPAALRPDLETIRQKTAEINAHLAQYENIERGGGPEVTYELANVEITGTGPRYLEFDVNIHDDAGTKYLYYAAARIVYDTLVFGPNIGQTVNCEVTNGDLISDLNCYGYSYPNDLLSNDFYAFAYPSFQSNCKALVPTTPVQLFHIKMTILDCIGSNITLADTAFFFGPSVMLYYSAYSNIPEEEDTLFFYSSLQAGQVEFIAGCGPEITSFTPTTVAGGIGQVLEIHGQGFGATRGSGTVFFKNANDAGNSEVACDVLDFSAPLGLWSDTLIRLIIPSNDTAIVGTVATPNSPAGTGIFRIVTNDDTELISPWPIRIKYSISTNFTTDSLSKPPLKLAPWDQNNGQFKFRLDESVANFQGGAAIPVIKKALREWTCLTGVDWVLQEDSIYGPLTAPAIDSISVIKFGEIGMLSSTNNVKVQCGGELYTVETDIILSDDPTLSWFIDTVPDNAFQTGSWDFYAIVLHELGHVHSLKHVNDRANVMFCYSDTAIRKIQLYNDTSAYEGGNWIIDYSVADPPATTCELTVVNVVDAVCDFHYGLDEFDPAFSHLKFGPNPATTFLDLWSLDKTISNISVYNALGKLTLTFSSLRTNRHTIDLVNVNTGLYRITVSFSDNTSASSSFLKVE